MIHTSSLKHYKELRAKGITCRLVTKDEFKTKQNEKS